MVDRTHDVVPTKFGYCPICDVEELFITEDIMVSCPYCGHHLNPHTQHELDSAVEMLNAIPLVNPISPEELRKVL